VARRPGFIDEGAGRELAESPSAAEQPAVPTSAPANPRLLDLPEVTQSSGDRIDPAWAPATIGTVRTRGGSLSWLAAGLTLMAAGWVCLLGVAFLHDQFTRSSSLGLLTLAILTASAGVVLRGAVLEAQSYRALRRVDSLRRALADPETGLTTAKRLSRVWVDAVAERLASPDAALKAIEAAGDAADLRAILHARVDAALDRVARQAALGAATQAGALVAVVPSPALDGVFTGLRGLALVRQIAQIYGLRPGITVTLSLLRRVALTAASVSGAELLAASAADAVLHDVPVIKHLVRAATGTGVAASRLYRLGLIAARACSPLAQD
jgi:putative membrane protein